MINILFVHSSSEMYGSDKSLMYIVNGLDESKYKISVILPCKGPLYAELIKNRKLNVSIFPVAVLRKKNQTFLGAAIYIRDLFLSIRYLKQYIKNQYINVVVTNTSVVFPGAIAAKISKVKSVWHVREIISNRFINTFISIIINTFSDITVANSQATAYALIINPKKLRVVYNAVEKIQVQSTHNQTYLTVGTAGRINRWKGQELFVDMVEQVHELYPNVRFVIAGDCYNGEEYLLDKLVSYIADKRLENCIQLVGLVKNMDEFYKNIDIFVLPSIKPEPFGNVLIEAMQYELPVVATRAGGPMEIVDDGENGYLVDSNSSTEMAERISTLLSDDNKRIAFGKAAKQKVTNHYLLDKMLSCLDEIYALDV